MEATFIYAIIAGSIFLLLIILKLWQMLLPWQSTLKRAFARHITYPYVLQRHRLMGPWSRGIVFIHIAYFVSHVVIILFQDRSLVNIRARAGVLSLVNLILPLSAIHLSYLADILGLSLRNYRRLHRSVAWMCSGLLLIHVGASFLEGTANVTTSRSQGWSHGGSGVGLLMLFSLPAVRKLSYEIFLRLHQALAVLSFYGIWQHVPATHLFPRLYVYLIPGICASTLTLQVVNLLYRNGLFSGRGLPRAILCCNSAATIQNAAIRIKLTLPRPVKVLPGQYINIWFPSVSMSSWIQTHPLTITSWAPGKQEALELLLHPRNGQSSSIYRQVRALEVRESLSLVALWTGPHGISVSVGSYENVILVASGPGLAAVIPYVSMLIHGHNTCTMNVRRVHLIWQVKELDFAISSEHLLNGLLEDDVLDNGYILIISIYIEGLLQDHNSLLFGRHDRAFLYQGLPDYRSIIDFEASGEAISKFSTVRDEHGKTLMMVSSEDRTRDHIRSLVTRYLSTGVSMVEMEYQP
ncbi:unnamed protein product [Penicillium olsonii]|nr:unnamed protein product [Penicillium olsonii]CAG8119810.1 unnamed protein product [Penicillium olsonii]